MRNEWRLAGAGAILAAAALYAACGDAPRAVDETQPTAGLKGAAAPAVPTPDIAAQTAPDQIDQSAGGVQPPPSGSGAITGRVALTGRAPGNPLIRMGADPLCARANRGKRVTQEAVRVTAGGGLADAFVTLDGAFPNSPVPTAPVTIDQQDCIYGPRVVGVRVGQTLAVQNHDALMHNVHGVSSAGNDFNVSQPKAGTTQRFPMKGAETMLRLRCDVHSWMTAYVGVVAHPYFSVSSADGTFTIPDVPVGTHTIRIWHERFGELTQTIRVRADATTMVEFAFTGTEKPPTAGIRDLHVPAVAHLAVR